MGKIGPLRLGALLDGHLHSPPIHKSIHVVCTYIHKSTYVSHHMRRYVRMSLCIHVHIHENTIQIKTYRFRIPESELRIPQRITMSQLGGREVLIQLGNVILSMSVADAAATLQDCIIGWVGGIALLI